MNYNNGYRKKGSVFEVFKIIFQIVGTFIILMVIGMSLVLALSAGKMEDKINDIKNYALRMFGWEEKTLKEEQNPIPAENSTPPVTDTPEEEKPSENDEIKDSQS